MPKVSPAKKARSALRRAIAADDWDIIMRRTRLADIIIGKDGQLAAMDKLVYLSSAACSAAEAQDRGRFEHSAVTAISLLEKVITAEIRGEICSRCGRYKAAYVQFSGPRGVTLAASVLCAQCFNSDLESVPAAEALARTYRLCEVVIKPDLAPQNGA